MKKLRDKPIPMLEALQALNADGAQKAAAFRFLRSDLSRLRSLADCEQAASGLLAAQHLLGPLDPGYLHTLTALRKMLDATIKRRLLPARGFDAAITELESAWAESIGTVLPYAPVEVQDQLGMLMRSLFDGVREDLAKF